jgi:hypothetical protein
MIGGTVKYSWDYVMKVNGERAWADRDGFGSDTRLLYTSSTSIFFVAGSNLVMRNLRTCPDWISCGFEDSATAPLFQRAASIELSEATSVPGSEA